MGDNNQDFTSLDDLAKEFEEEENSDIEDNVPPKSNGHPKDKRKQVKEPDTIIDACKRNIKELLFLTVIVFLVINPYTVQKLIGMVPNITTTMDGEKALEECKFLNWKGSLVQLGVILIGFLVFKIMNHFGVV